MNRLGRSVLMDTPLLSLDETIERLEAVDARADLEQLARELYPPARHVGRRDRPRRGAASAGRSAPVSAELSSRVIRVAVSGAAGRMGQTVCDAVEGADDMELVGARRPGARRVARARCSTEAQPDVVVDFTDPGHRVRQRARCAWSAACTRWSARPG